MGGRKDHLDRKPIRHNTVAAAAKPENLEIRLESIPSSQSPSSDDATLTSRWMPPKQYHNMPRYVAPKSPHIDPHHQSRHSPRAWVVETLPGHPKSRQACVLPLRWCCGTTGSGCSVARHEHQHELKHRRHKQNSRAETQRLLPTLSA